MFESLGIPGATIILELGAGPLIVFKGASFIFIFIISVVGLVVGSVISYALGYYGRDVVNRFLPESVREKRRETRESVESFLKKYGAAAVFLAQLFGPTRTWGSYPAGYYRINFFKFFIFTLLGGSVYCLAIILLSIFYATTASLIAQSLSSYLKIPLWTVIPLAVLIFLTLGVLSAKALFGYMKKQ